VVCQAWNVKRLVNSWLCVFEVKLDFLDQLSYLMGINVINEDIIMKNLNVLLLLILALTVSSCSQPSNQGNDELSRTVEKLESKIDDLQKKLDAQEIKTRISFMQISPNPLFNTSWEDFLLASDDFWKNPVDVGLFECSKSCVRAAKERRSICAAKPDGQEKIQCFDESSAKASSCQISCQKRFPPKFD